MLYIGGDGIKIEFKRTSHQVLPLSLRPAFKKRLTLFGHNRDPLLVDNADQAEDDAAVRFRFRVPNLSDFGPQREFVTGPNGR